VKLSHLVLEDLDYLRAQVLARTNPGGLYLAQQLLGYAAVAGRRKDDLVPDNEQLLVPSVVPAAHDAAVRQDHGARLGIEEHADDTGHGLPPLAANGARYSANTEEGTTPLPRPRGHRVRFRAQAS